MGCERLMLAPPDIGFVSANGWDVDGAKAAGLTTFWNNRGGSPIERHGEAPDFVVGSLSDVATIVTA